MTAMRRARSEGDSERSASSLVSRILEIHGFLASSPSLAPSLEVDTMFTELVEITMRSSEETAATVLSDPRILAIGAELHKICSNRVCEREKYWARRLLSTSERGISLALEQTPYYDNYRRLSRLEANTVFAISPRFVSTVLFAGAGALPMTAIFLAREHGITMDCVDLDPEACSLAREVIHRLGLEGKVRIHHADIADFEASHPHDALFVAALVGLSSSEKSRVLDRLTTIARGDSLLVCRSAHRLKTLLYPKVELTRSRDFHPILELHPHNGLINSVVIFQRGDQIFQRVDPSPGRPRAHNHS